jgi:hypothetical protein
VVLGFGVVVVQADGDGVEVEADGDVVEVEAEIELVESACECFFVFFPRFFFFFSLSYFSSSSSPLHDEAIKPASLALRFLFALLFRIALPFGLLRALATFSPFTAGALAFASTKPTASSSVGFACVAAASPTSFSPT